MIRLVYRLMLEPDPAARKQLMLAFWILQDLGRVTFEPRYRRFTGSD